VGDGDERRETRDGDERRETGDERRETGDERRVVLFVLAAHRGGRDSMLLGLRWPVGALQGLDVHYEYNFWVEAGAVAVVIFVTCLAALGAWRLFFGKKILWRDAGNAFRRPWKKKVGGDETGFRFADESVSAGNKLVELAWFGLLVSFVGGVAMIAGSAIAGILVYRVIGVDGDVFGLLLYVGLFGGIVLPFALFLVAGIFFGSWFGGQSLSRYGFLVSIPFAAWFFVGLFVCDDVFWFTDSGVAVGPAIASLLGDAHVEVSLEPLLPGWVYWAVMALFVGGWLLLGGRRRVLPWQTSGGLLGAVASGESASEGSASEESVLEVSEAEESGLVESLPKEGDGGVL